MHHQTNHYSLDLPYPEVISTKSDPHDLKLIFPLYTGLDGELRAVTQYSYQHFVLEKLNPDIAATLIGIAIVEMRHLGYLGEAIKTLGGIPKYINPKTKNFWDASTVCYDQNIPKALENNIKIETYAYNSYLETAKKVCNPTLAALLERIAMDEKLHLEQFEHLLKQFCGNNRYKDV